MSRLIRPCLAAFTCTAALALAACGSSNSSSSSSTPVVSSGVVESVSPVVVNGTTFSTTGANIVVNGVAGQSQSELKVGRIVRVHGSSSGRSGEATEVEIEPIYQGRAGTVLPPPTGSGNTTRVDSRGQQTAIDDSTVVVDQSGTPTTVVDSSHISVHGFPDDSGVIRATRIEVSSSTADDFQLKGYVTNLVTATKTFELNVSSSTPAVTALLVTADAGVSLPAGIANGSFVEVRSTTPGSNPIIASSVTLEDPKLGTGIEAEVEGVVTGGDGSSFTVQGTTVETGAATVFENGVKNDIVPGIKVEAEGSLDANGVLQAKKVSLRASVRLTGVPSSAVVSGTFQLLGFTVHVDEFTDVTGGAVNTTQAFEVRARLHANGTHLVAERIDNRGNESRIFVQGPVTATTPASNTFTMLGLTVNVAGASLRDVDDTALNAAAFFAKVSAGTVVKARGASASALSGTTLTAEQAEIEGDR